MAEKLETEEYSIYRLLEGKIKALENNRRNLKGSKMTSVAQLTVDIKVNQTYAIKRQPFGSLQSYYSLDNQKKVNCEVSRTQATLKTTENEDILKVYDKPKVKDSHCRAVLFCERYFTFQSMFKDIIIISPAFKFKRHHNNDYQLKFIYYDSGELIYHLKPYNKFNTRWELVKEDEQDIRLAKLRVTAEINSLADITFFYKFEDPILAILLAFISFVVRKAIDE